MDRIKENNKPIFDINDRNYNVKAWYLVDTEKSKGDAVVEITKKQQIVRKFIFPSYKIWNIAAHFQDIVDSEMAQDAVGYEIAASTGLGGSVGYKEVKL